MFQENGEKGIHPLSALRSWNGCCSNSRSPAFSPAYPKNLGTTGTKSKIVSTFFKLIRLAFLPSIESMTYKGGLKKIVHFSLIVVPFVNRKSWNRSEKLEQCKVSDGTWHFFVVKWRCNT